MFSGKHVEDQFIIQLHYKHKCFHKMSVKPKNIWGSNQILSDVSSWDFPYLNVLKCTHSFLHNNWKSSLNVLHYGQNQE